MPGTPISGKTPRMQSKPQAKTNSGFQIDATYLRNGYFDPKTQELRPEILDTLARQVAKLFARTGMKPNQLRRFFDPLRAAERNLDAQQPFTQAKAQLQSLVPEVSRQAARRLVTRDFVRFIEKNVELAIQNEANFRQGFIPHYQAVIGFFEYERMPKPK